MAIIAGLSKNCSTLCGGGVKRLWIANYDDIASFTFGTDNEVTTITMVATKKFYEVELKRQSKIFTETTNVSEGGCGYSLAQNFTGIGQCRDQDARNWLLSVAKQSCCGIVAVHEEANGFVGVWGYIKDQSIYLGGGTVISTGTTLADPSQITLELLCDTTMDGLATELTGGVAAIEALT
jgi:hypothetical protein